MFQHCEVKRLFHYIPEWVLCFITGPEAMGQVAIDGKQEPKYTRWTARHFSVHHKVDTARD